MIPATRLRPSFAAPALALALTLSFTSAPLSAADAVPRYQKISLETQFYSEGAAFGDFNKDGKLDAVSGPYWWEGPDFTKRHDIYPALPFDPLKYSDNFFAFVHDFNGDTWPDVLVLGFPGVDASWFENPGAKGGPWRRHVVFLPVDNESPTFGDLLGKGQPALICMSAGRLGYATFNPKDATLPWTFHPASPLKPNFQRFTHGLGWGDVNGDGRNDLLEKDGWWEQPASLAGDPAWTFHKFDFCVGGRGGAQMYVLDVNGDGLPDVITSLNAHGYGVYWHEQKRDATGGITFEPHAITSGKPDERISDVQFAQPHAITLADFDGDGLPDIVTGKRWWAHGPTGDADPNGTPVLYAFLLRRGANGTASYVPHLIDDTTGIGTQLVTADVNGDGRPDIVVGNKRGTAVLLSQKPGAISARR